MRVALTFSLFTALCGGTSWPADPAPHWPGWHGRLCRAHDHCAGTAGELSHSGGEVAEWVQSSHELQIPKCLSQPQPGQQQPEARVPLSLVVHTPYPRLGPDFCLLRLSSSTHSYPVLNWLLPAWRFLIVAPPAPDLSPGVPLPNFNFIRVFICSYNFSSEQP